MCKNSKKETQIFLYKLVRYFWVLVREVRLVLAKLCFQHCFSGRTDNNSLCIYAYIEKEKCVWRKKFCKCNLVQHANKIVKCFRLVKEVGTVRRKKENVIFFFATFLFFLIKLDIKKSHSNCTNKNFFFVVI